MPCLFRNECIASIPFNVRYADVRFLNASFGPRIRFIKDYKKSILSTDGQGWNSESYKEYVVPDTMRTLSLKAAWSDTIPNNGGIGKVTVSRDGQRLGQFTVPVGEVVERTFDVRGGGDVMFHLVAYDPKNDQERVPSSGLAVLTPIVK